MGVPTITAGRILKGQLEGKTGEESVLAMDRFSHLGLSRVSFNLILMHTSSSCLISHVQPCRNKEFK